MWAVLDVNNKFEAICFASIDQTEKLCLAFVEHNGLFLQFVKVQTQRICSAAVKQNIMAVKFADEQFKSISLKQYIPELTGKRKRDDDDNKDDDYSDSDDDDDNDDDNDNGVPESKRKKE